MTVYVRGTYLGNEGTAFANKTAQPQQDLLDYVEREDPSPEFSIFFFVRNTLTFK